MDILKVFAIVKNLFHKHQAKCQVTSDTGTQRPFLGLSCSVFFDNNVLESEKCLTLLMSQTIQ